MSLETIWTDIRRGENLDLYLTILVSCILIIANLLGVNIEERLASIVLGVLAFSTITSLVNRNKLDNIYEDLKLLGTSRITDEFPAILSEHIKGAKEIWMIGIHHSSIMNEYFHSFRTMIENGGVLNIIVVDPEGEACKMTAMRFAGNVAVDQERARTRANLQIFQRLSAISPTKVTVKTLDYLFEYSAL